MADKKLLGTFGDTADVGFVKSAGDETIAGTKTFQNQIIASAGISLLGGSVSTVNGSVVVNSTSPTGALYTGGDTHTLLCIAHFYSGSYTGSNAIAVVVMRNLSGTPTVYITNISTPATLGWAQIGSTYGIGITSSGANNTTVSYSILRVR